MTLILPWSQLAAATDAEGLTDCVSLYARHHGYPPGEDTPLRDWCFPRFAPRLVWATRCIGPAGPRIAVAVAAKAARRVLPVFEATYPGDARPRTALDLVDRWLDGASVRRELVAVRVRRPVAERIADILLRPHTARAVRVAHAVAEVASAVLGAKDGAFAADHADRAAGVVLAVIDPNGDLIRSRELERDAQWADFMAAMRRAESEPRGYPASART